MPHDLGYAIEPLADVARQVKLQDPSASIAQDRKIPSSLSCLDRTKRI